jgi:hypothetical protein
MSYSDAFGVLKELSAGGKTVKYFSLPELAKRYPQINRFPVSIKVLLESVLRNVNGVEVSADHVENFLKYDPGAAERCRNTLYPRKGSPPGFYRRALRRRPGGAALCHAADGRGSFPY